MPPEPVEPAAAAPTRKAGRQLECDVCGKLFTRVRNLRRHRLIHSGAKSFVCSICGKRFNRRDNMVTHRRTHTADEQ